MKRIAYKTETNEANLVQLVRDMKVGEVLHITEPTRSLDQNALLWPLLDEIAAHVVWHGVKLKSTEWKDIFTAALKKSKVVPGLDGGFVVCGQSTSSMSKAYFSELIELIYAFGAEQGVKFKSPARES